MKTIVSVIIPIYNEERYIEKLIQEIKKIKLRNFLLEIICVNDGSTDNTLIKLKKIKKIRIINQKNQGKGKAVQVGIKNAKGKLCLIQDADLEYSPKDYQKLLKPFLNEKKIAVYGSRFINKNNIFGLNLTNKNKQSFSSFFFNFVLSFIFFFKKKIFISDLLTGYKIYEKNFFKHVKIKTNGFETDHEITLKLLKLNYKIVEIPISFSPRSKKEGKKINFSDAIKAVKLIIGAQ